MFPVTAASTKIRLAYRKQVDDMANVNLFILWVNQNDTLSIDDHTLIKFSHLNSLSKILSIEVAETIAQPFEDCRAGDARSGAVEPQGYI